MQPGHPDKNPSSVTAAVKEGVVVPLAALRATLESLADRLAGDDREQGTLATVLEHFRSLERNVLDLVDLCAPSELHSLRCSIAEIQKSAIRSLCDVEKSRVWLALESETHSFDVDGVRLSHCIALLLRNAFDEGCGQVLLHGSRTANGVSFTIVAGDKEPRVLTPARPALTARNIVQLALAEREIDRMGGTLTFSRTEARRLAACVHFETGSRRQEVA
jgi:hypothetical protein